MEVDTGTAVIMGLGTGTAAVMGLETAAMILTAETDMEPVADMEPAMADIIMADIILADMAEDAVVKPSLFRRPGICEIISV